MWATIKSILMIAVFVVAVFVLLAPITTYQFISQSAN